MSIVILSDEYDYSNSLPKGGLKYTYLNGKQYVYAIFWTRFINDTGNPFEFTINFL
jgi:hypothetical protein